jgi:hypothetical protein
VSAVARFPFVSVRAASGVSETRPLIPVELHTGTGNASSLALLDTGSSINVLPFSMGQKLGGNWSTQPVVPLGGILAGVAGRALFAELRLGSFPSKTLAFAWLEDDQAPLILGQFNFFLEFDVCFFRLSSQIEVRCSR